MKYKVGDEVKLGRHGTFRIIKIRPKATKHCYDVKNISPQAQGAFYITGDWQITEKVGEATPEQVKADLAEFQSKRDDRKESRQDSREEKFERGDSFAKRMAQSDTTNSAKWEVVAGLQAGDTIKMVLRGKVTNCTFNGVNPDCPSNPIFFSTPRGARKKAPIWMVYAEGTSASPSVANVQAGTLSRTMDPHTQETVNRLVAKMEDLHRNGGGGDYQDTYKQECALLDELGKISDSLKSQGLVPGRMVKYQVADGYAHYVVVSVSPQVSYLRHVPFLDGYQSPAVGRDGAILTSTLRDHLQYEDKLGDLFSKKKG